MIFDAETLDPKFLKLCRKLLHELGGRGILVKPVCGIRSPKEQAKLWRRSRETEHIEEMIDKLELLGAPYIAQCLRDAGPQTGSWATNSLPGESWHQWGEAMDLLVMNDAGVVVDDGDDPQYTELGEIAKELGLTSGAFWVHKDAGHVQLRKEGVRTFYEWYEIDRIMRSKFS